MKVNYADKTELKKYWGYLANSVVFIQISTDVSSALKIFETVNERGVGLNPMDLLKNLLFTQVQKSDFTRLKTEWEKITKPLALEKEKPLRFLRYFLMASYPIQSQRSDAVVREDEIYDWFVKPENETLCNYKPEPFVFVRKIIQSADHYVNFGKGRGNDGSASVAMDNLRRLTGGAFSLQNVLLLASSNFPTALFNHFVAQLESFLFFYIFTKTATKELERNFSVWADELRSIGGIPDEGEQREGLNAFLASRFQAGMAAKDGELGDALKRYNLYSMQQYRTRYLLQKLAQHIDVAFTGLKTAGSLGDYNGLEVEHILPNNPKPELLASFKLASPGAVYTDYKIKLGNLTLLEKPLNIIAGNDFFAKKKDKYEACRTYLTRSLVGLADFGGNSSISRINEKLTAFDDWSAASIDQRQTLIIALAREIWKVVPAS